MTILTPETAANFLRSDTDDPVMQQLLPLVDTYLRSATGHDWSADDPAHDTAIMAAGMLLVHWYDNPLLVGQTPAAFSSLLVQLEAEALKYRKYSFYGNSAAGAIAVPGAGVGDEVLSLTGVYGLTDDQSAKFEATVSADGQIQQTYGGDLSECQFVAVLKHPAEDVSA